MNSYRHKTPENIVVKDTSNKPLTAEQVKAHNAKPIKRSFASKDVKTII